jgi:muramoyltetrapeptide carboxypeptidase LdcA involved in peptidoglycan recycling
MADKITPPALKTGDTIALVSPSTRLNETWPAVLNRSIAHLKSLGFQIKVIYSPLQGSFTDQIKQRVEELHSAFADPEVQAILTTMGGNHANELSRRLDYDLIRKNPKIFCGYSDTTNLHGALYTQAGLRTFYGPAAITEFGDFPKPMEFTTNHFLKVLCDGKEPIGKIPRSIQWARELPSFTTTGDQAHEQPRTLVPTPAWKWLRPGKAEGRIWGGVLTSLLELAGTPYWPDMSGGILLIESSFGNTIFDPVPTEKTRYQLGDLANIGVFDQINGLIFGRINGQSEQLDAELAEVLLGQTEDWSFPILTNVDVGHTAPNLTIPLGSLVRLDSEKDEWVILEPSVA